MDTNGNYCGVTENSTVPYTDEDLSLAEGLKRIQLAHASKKPWWVSIGNHRPHTVFRVPQVRLEADLSASCGVEIPNHCIEYVG